MTRVSQVGQNLLISAGDVFARCAPKGDGTFWVDVSLNNFEGKGYCGEALYSFKAVVDDFGNLYRV
jgi:hypothetical protein